MTIRVAVITRVYIDRIAIVRCYIQSHLSVPNNAIVSIVSYSLAVFPFRKQKLHSPLSIIYTYRGTRILYIYVADNIYISVERVKYAFSLSESQTYT